MRIPVLIIGAVLLLYGFMNYYVGLRGWQAFGRLLPGAGVIYWGLVIFAAISVFLGAFLGNRGLLPGRLGDWVTFTGYYWLPLILYLFIAVVALDILRFLDRRLHLAPDGIVINPAAAGAAVLLLAVGLILYGAWNAAYNTQTRHFDLVIDKNAANLDELQVVLVSDIHMGKVVDSGRIKRLVDRINSLNPDLIVIPGDIIDGNLAPYIDENIGDILAELKAEYGIYAVFGNHDYIGGIDTESQRLLREAGIMVLRDEYQLVAGSFYIAGREDISASRFGGSTRKPLREIVADTDPAKPLILLDHQPFNLDEGRKNGVDLQLSGHTHHGQFFPINLITGRLYEKDWGYLEKDGAQLVVSCGYGTWGPPLRIGSVSEIVTLTVKFNNF